MLSLSMLRQNLVKIHSFVLKILSGSKILILFKGRNSVIDRRKLMLMMLNNPELDVVNLYVHAKFGQNPFSCCKDIEGKQNSDIIQGP